VETHFVASLSTDSIMPERMPKVNHEFMGDRYAPETHTGKSFQVVSIL
jgi:hypothetical protein